MDAGLEASLVWTIISLTVRNQAGHIHAALTQNEEAAWLSK
jgi:hypothetical protein